MNPIASDRTEKMKEPCSEAAAPQCVCKVEDFVMTRDSDRTKKVQPTIRAGKDL